MSGFEWTESHLQECLASAELIKDAFVAADANGDGMIGAHEAPAFFLPSGLPGDVLSRIWRLSAPDNALRTPGQLRVALNMSLQAMRGHEIPEAGISPPPSPTASAAAMVGSGGGTTFSAARPGSASEAATAARRTTMRVDEVEPVLARFKDVAEVLASIGPADANKYENHLNNVSQGASGWVLAAPARAYFIERGSMQPEAVDAILRFAGKETAAVLEHDDFFVAIHLVYLAFQDRQRSLQQQQQAQQQAQQQQQQVGITDAGGLSRARAFSLTPSRLSQVTSAVDEATDSLGLRAQTLPATGASRMQHRRATSAELPISTSGAGAARAGSADSAAAAAAVKARDAKIRTLEAKLERQRGELQEVQELLAEAAATDDAEFIEEASQEVASREANIARTEADLVRLQAAAAAPAGGSEAQAMSLRARLRKLQASDASDRRATAPAGAVPEGAQDDFTFSPVQGASPTATPRSGAPQPDAFGALLSRTTSELPDSGPAPPGRHRRHRSASAGADGGFRPSRPAPAPPPFVASLRAASSSEEQPTLDGHQPPVQPAAASLAAALPVSAVATASGGDVSSETTPPAGVPGGTAALVEGPSELHTSDSAVAVAGSTLGDSINGEDAGSPPPVPRFPGAAPGQETLEAATAASTAAVAGSVGNDGGDPASQSVAVAGSDGDVVPRSDAAPAEAPTGSPSHAVTLPKDVAGEATEEKLAALNTEPSDAALSVGAAAATVPDVIPAPLTQQGGETEQAEGTAPETPAALPKAVTDTIAADSATLHPSASDADKADAAMVGDNIPIPPGAVPEAVPEDVTAVAAHSDPTSEATDEKVSSSEPTPTASAGQATERPSEVAAIDMPDAEATDAALTDAATTPPDAGAHEVPKRGRGMDSGAGCAALGAAGLAGAGLLAAGAAAGGVADTGTAQERSGGGPVASEGSAALGPAMLALRSQGRGLDHADSDALDAAESGMSPTKAAPGFRSTPAAATSPASAFAASGGSNGPEVPAVEGVSSGDVQDVAATEEVAPAAQDIGSPPASPVALHADDITGAPGDPSLVIVGTTMLPLAGGDSSVVGAFPRIGSEEVVTSTGTLPSAASVEAAVASEEKRRTLKAPSASDLVEDSVASGVQGALPGGQGGEDSATLPSQAAEPTREAMSPTTAEVAPTTGIASAAASTSATTTTTAAAPDDAVTPVSPQPPLAPPPTWESFGDAPAFPPPPLQPLAHPPPPPTPFSAAASPGAHSGGFMPPPVAPHHATLMAPFPVEQLSGADLGPQSSSEVPVSVAQSVLPPGEQAPVVDGAPSLASTSSAVALADAPSGAMIQDATFGVMPADAAYTPVFQTPDGSPVHTDGAVPNPLFPEQQDAPPPASAASMSSPTSADPTAAPSAPRADDLTAPVGEGAASSLSEAASSPPVAASSPPAGGGAEDGRGGASSLAEREWGMPPPATSRAEAVPALDAEDVFGTLLPVEFMARRATSPPASPPAQRDSPAEPGAAADPPAASPEAAVSDAVAATVSSETSAAALAAAAVSNAPSTTAATTTTVPTTDTMSTSDTGPAASSATAASMPEPSSAPGIVASTTAPATGPTAVGSELPAAVDAAEDNPFQAFSGQMSQPQSQPQQQSLATLGSPGPASRALTGPAPTATGGAVGGADFGAGPGLSNGFEATAFRGTPDGWDQAFGHTPSLQLQLAGAPGSTPPLGQQLQLASQPFPGGSGGFGSFEGPFELTGAGPSSGGADQQLTLMAPAPVPGWAGFDGGVLAPSNAPFVAGGTTAPAGWASFGEGNAFMTPPPTGGASGGDGGLLALEGPPTADVPAMSATAPTGTFDPNTQSFDGGSAVGSMQPAFVPPSPVSAPAPAVFEGVSPPGSTPEASSRRAVSKADSFNIASVLSSAPSGVTPDLLSEPPSPVAEFGLPAGRNAAAGGADLAGYHPLTPEDVQRCTMAYSMKGYGDKGGAAHDEAWHLWGRAGLVDGFSAAFALADADRDHRLNEQEFAVFMWLLKSSRKGLPLPGAPLSPAQLQQFIGIGASPEQSSLQYQGSISFGGARDAAEAAEAAQAAQAAMQDQELQELVALGFPAESAKAALEQHDWNLQPAADQLLAQRESEARSAFQDPSDPANAVAVATAGGNGDAPPSSSGIAAQSMTAAVPHKSHNPLHGLTSALRRRVSLHAATSLGPKTPQPLQMPAEDAAAAAAEGASASGGGLSPGSGRMSPTGGRASPALTPRSSTSTPRGGGGAAASRAGSGPTPLTSDGARLSVTINSARVKYSKELDRPFITVSIIGANGIPLEVPDDTPPGAFDRSTGNIALDHQLVLRTPAVQLPSDANLFVEIKHWKSKEKKFSLLAWSFLPCNILVSRPDANTAGEVAVPTVSAGPCQLPLYQKPLDVTVHRTKPVGGEVNLTIAVAP